MNDKHKHPVRYVCRIEYERDGLLRALLNTGRLPQADIWRRDLVERQLSLLIAEWARGEQMTSRMPTSFPAPMLRDVLRPKNPFFRAAAAVLRAHVTGVSPERVAKQLYGKDHGLEPLISRAPVHRPA